MLKTGEKMKEKSVKNNKLNALKIESISINKLQEYENNAKLHPEEQIEQIINSILKFGFNDPIAVDENNRIIEGHGRLLALKRLGYKTAPIIRLDHLTEDEKKAYILAHNKLTMNTGFDEEMLKAELESIVDIDMSDFGFDYELGDIGDIEDIADNEIHDKVPDDAPKRTTLGDIWQLGRHRLMCGSSTDKKHVQSLMDGGKADICFTSPPYGVGRSSGLRHQKAAGRDNSKDITSFYQDDENLSEWKSLMSQFFSIAQEVSTVQFINVQLLGDNKRDLVKFLSDSAESLCDVMIWDKERAIPNINRNVLSSRFEFVFIFDKENPSKALRFGDFRGDVANLFSVKHEQNAYADKHKAVFPLSLPLHFLDINSKATSVYEPFCGTGTTLIAAETMGKTCYAMELNPEYCDITLKRWEDFTGESAVLIERTA